MARSVLVIDDEDSVRASIVGVLSDEGYKVSSAASGAQAFEFLSKDFFDVVMLDVWMTGPTGEKQQEGLEILGKIKAQYPELVVVIMSGHGSIETAVRATKLGAYDFIEKPLSLDKLLLILQNALQFRDLARENELLRSRVAKSKMMIGESGAIQNLKNAIKRVAGTNSWVLITGENGTGKELVAHSIHALSPRFDKPFIEVNCAAIPEELIESELFGHERGSFTGATQLKRGKFDLANGGTLFLDEIGDMSLKTQAKVLRILQERRFERVGGSQTIEVDVRVLAATNKNLEEEIKNNNFREDLYYRLNVVQFKVPALRDRKEDIALLAQHYFEEFSALGATAKRLSLEAIAILEQYPWPGNVRELKNTIERLVIFTDEAEITPESLVSVLPHLEKVSVLEKSAVLGGGISAFASSLKDAKSGFEKEFILSKLKENDWNVTRTAKLLGIERAHLHRKIKMYGIDERVSD